jgi:predicted ATPase
MARLTLSLLGGFHARLDLGPPMALPAKAQALLAYLALSAGQAQPRDKLGTLLWGDTADEQARSNLRHTLFTIRRALGRVMSAALATEGKMVTLAPAAVDADVQKFEALVREGTPASLELAAGLYRGELLDGLAVEEPRFEEWLLGERERLRELAIDALAQLLAHESKTGRTQPAIKTATRLLAMDPLQEAVHRALMRLYARQGRRAAALKQYQACVDLLKRELGAEPEPQTRQLYQDIRVRRDAVAPTALDVAEPPSLEASSARGGIPAPYGERKYVTVLFADLCGFAVDVLDRDPEEARRLLDPLLERMMDTVRRYGGTVNAVLGAGVVALFGAPRAQEDHAVRACYAALALRETITRQAAEVQRLHRADLAVRIGLHSGEIVVRSSDSDLNADFGAVGQAMHLALRMDQLTIPGAIRLTAETRRLVEGFVDLRSLGRLAVKGRREPVEVFEMAGMDSARTPMHVAAVRGLTPFVGRDAEIALLASAAEATRGGHGRVVAVIGEPGVGKSRLLHEVNHAQRPRGWRILQTAGAAYSASMSYLPVISLLKSYIGVEARDTPREVADKLSHTVLALDPALEPTVPALAALLDVRVDDQEWPLLDPPQRRQRTLDAVKQLLIRTSQERPLLLFCEDLHWIDGETQALLDRLVESLPAVPLLMVVSYRPEYVHGWASKSQYAQLRLETLPAPATSKMLQVLVGDDESLESLKPLLAARAGGNPLFLEESVRALMETGVLEGERGAYRLTREVATVRVPTTVHAVLAARIDRLPAETKRLLQTAAVIGREVPFALLQVVVDLPDQDLREGLARLQDAELLYEATFLADPEYAFKHALIHEVAYGSLLEDRRRELHVRIVEAIEQLWKARVAEQVERLAHHAVRAELWEKAVGYLRQAGAKAAARSALPDARVWFEQAVSVLDKLPETPSTLEQGFQIRLELWPVLNLLGDPRKTLALLHEAEGLAQRLNDDRRRAQVSACAVPHHTFVGELDEALASGVRALAIARNLGDLEVGICSASLLEQVHYHRGEYRLTVEMARDNLATLPAEWVDAYLGIAVPSSIYDRCWLVMSLAELGRFLEAAVDETEAIRLAESTHRAAPVGLAHFAAGVRHLLQGNWATACDMIERWVAVVRSANVTLHLPIAVAADAWVSAQLGKTSEALSRLEEGEQLLERQAVRGFVGNLGWAYCSLGRACRLLGRLDDARRFGDHAIEFSPQQPGFRADALRLRGDIATDSDRFDAAAGEAHYRDALALAEPRGMRPLVAHCHLGLGKLYRRAGSRGRAAEHLALATAMYHDMGMRFWLERAEATSRESG